MKLEQQKQGIGSMKTQLLAFSAAALVALSSTAALARPDSQVTSFLKKVEAQADGRLAAAGVDLAGRKVTVKATVDADGLLYGVHVVRSSGSRDADYAIEQALHRLRVNDAPAQLAGADVTFVLDHGLQQASVR
jgi:TonB family protein